MTGFESSPIVSIVKRIPRKSEYLIMLSDGTELRVLEDHMDRFGLVEGACLDQATIERVSFAYAYGKARQSALRLLKVRPRTEAELRRRFPSSRVPGDVVDRLIDDLKAEGLVDDRIFAQLWIAEKTARGTSGRRRIVSDLQAKGVSPTIIREALQEHYADAAEIEIAQGVARKRVRRLADLPIQVKRERIYNYLLRRGFESDIAGEATDRAIQSLSGEAEDEIR